MVTKEKKREIVAGLVRKLGSTRSVYLVDASAMTVAQSGEIRREFRKVNAEMKLAKNTLIRRALQEDGKFTVHDTILKGNTALVFAYADPIAPAKVIRKYFEKDKKPSLKLAIIEGQVFDSSQLKVVSELPSREDMIAGILGSLHSPISGIVGTINAVMRDIASLVEEVAKKQGA
ncbi:MAG: 50S ribosomal protein L10 [Bacteroidota bacterium]|nr:50S ribosomal protein L10 [Candidatus Kapabacteria bacterium]MDW8220900.1 50S ribosomal protein L10 [Bacteroidota bacterium]